MPKDVFLCSAFQELLKEKNSVSVQLDQGSRRLSQLEEEKRSSEQSFKRTQGLLDDVKGERCVSDVPTQKYEGSRGLRSDGVGLRMTESEKYKLGLNISTCSFFLRTCISTHCKPLAMKASAK